MRKRGVIKVTDSNVTTADPGRGWATAGRPAGPKSPFLCLQSKV